MILFPVLLLATALPSAVDANPAAETIAIVGADILPMTTKARLRDQTIIVRGDRIVRLGSRRVVAIPPGARRIAAKGLVVMPGLVDMHVHLPAEAAGPDEAPCRPLALMIGHGITTARAMQASPAALGARTAIERGTLAGPRLYVASPIVNDDTAPTPDAARAAVRNAARQGYDLVKTHQITQVAVWQALIDQARADALPVAGHVGNEIGLPRALAAGQEVEHLDGALFELLPVEGSERRLRFAQIPPPAAIVAAERAEPHRLADLARRVARARSFQVPTLASFERGFDPALDTASLMERDAALLVDAAQRQAWAASRDAMRRAMPAKDAATFLRLRRAIVAAYSRANVRIMAGSDTPQPFHLWGEGLIRELEALVAAGLTPLQALRSATVVPRDYFRTLPRQGSALGWRADFGTVEPGARADLLLLERDPSKDLSALHSIRAVVAAGRIHERAWLDDLVHLAPASCPGPQNPEGK